MSTAIDTGVADGHAWTSGRIRRYFLLIAAVVLLEAFVGVLVLSWPSYDGLLNSDHLLQITNDGDAHWYRDFGGRYTPAIQDQDIFYSKVGRSIDAVKAADIVFLGPSTFVFGVDRQTLQSSPVLSKLKIYNMGFIGIRGGEFTRRIIKRWGVHAPLWIINVDDYYVHFFSSDAHLTLGPVKTPIEALRRSRLDSYVAVAGLNLRWRVEDLIARWRDGRPTPTGLPRNIENGDTSMATNARYFADNNPPLRLGRDPNCTLDPSTVAYGRSFLNEIGGNAVLTLVPHSQQCAKQATELAQALGVEILIPPYEGFTTVDDGGHLDKKGAERFTAYLADALVKTQAFKRAFGDKLGEIKQ